MNFGFETIGNATLICYDRRPILATDPWVKGSAYFGSWVLSHEVPAAQLEAVSRCPYVWFSHGHPDHLNGDSLDLFRDKQILVADHVGDRIRNDLTGEGFDVKVLPDRQWVNLTDRIRVLCIADYSQNSVLLVDMDGKLLVNLNDGIDRGWGRFVRKIVAGYEDSFLLALTGYGDADMINFYDEDGDFVTPPCARKLPVGPAVAQKTESFGCRFFIPFSSMHHYQRADSIWANQYATPVEDHYKGFASDQCEMLPAFIRYDCDTGIHESINPERRQLRTVDPSEFGDDWSQVLDAAEFKAVRDYFLKFAHLGKFLDFVNIRVGGRDNFIEYKKRKFDRGVTFEVPRGSLLEAVKWQVFDDLLIGNFMKTTLHGSWPASQLYPHFTPYVTKFGDNGHAFDRDELRHYFAAYLRRAPADFLHHWLEQKAIDAVRRVTPADTDGYRKLKRAYWLVKKHV